MDVAIKDNIPCFSLPANYKLTPPITSYGPIVYFKENDKWHTLLPLTDDAAPTIIMADGCQEWPDINWSAGEYRVILKAMTKEKNSHHMARFQLIKNSNESLQIIKSE